MGHRWVGVLALLCACSGTAIEASSEATTTLPVTTTTTTTMAPPTTTTEPVGLVGQWVSAFRARRSTVESARLGWNDCFEYGPRRRACTVIGVGQLQVIAKALQGIGSDFSALGPPPARIAELVTATLSTASTVAAGVERVAACGAYPAPCDVMVTPSVESSLLDLLYQRWDQVA